MGELLVRDQCIDTDIVAKYTTNMPFLFLFYINLCCDTLGNFSGTLRENQPKKKVV
jgi:hypothetical protein